MAQEKKEAEDQELEETKEATEDQTDQGETKAQTNEEQPSEEETSEEDPLAGLLEEDGAKEDEGESSAEKTQATVDLPEEDPLASLLGEEDEDDTEEDEEEEVSPEAEGGPSEEGSEESSKKTIILTVATSLFVLLFLGAGLGVLWYLWQHPPEVLPQKEEEIPPATTSSDQQEPPLTTAPIAVEDRQILFLKNFLIPYQRETGEYLFVKAKVLLYYANEKERRLAKQNEALLREHIYRVLKNVPLYVWENKKGKEVIRRELLSYLAKKEIGGIVPQDLEVTGYILK